MGKRLSFVFTIFVLTMILCGCQQESQTQPQQSNPKQPYPTEVAIKNGDVVNFHGKLSNLDQFEKFIENASRGAKDEIRITMYTVEGDPVFYQLVNDGNNIQYTYDDSQDGYAGSGRGIQSTTCTHIASENIVDAVVYTLIGCSSEVGDSFYFRIPK
ncbi:MAG TPA: DUF4362 domain-containing protein [Ureibacillus sp.]|nr:DUF4362 domain-containing protein [Ureibacillus sp.]